MGRSIITRLTITKLSSILSHLLFLITLVPLGDAARASETSPQGCPFQTPAQWQSFLQTYASAPFWVGTCPNGACNQEHYELVEKKIQATFDACSSFLSENKFINRCTDRYRRFVHTWLAQHDQDSYGFTVKNPVYLAQQETADKPAGMMQPPQAILEALPTRQKVEEAARNAGLKYLTHDSGLAGIRTFVLNADPVGRYDQWLLLNLPDLKSDVAEAEPMSVLVVQKKDLSGHRLAKVRLHFRDYFLERTPGGKFEARLHESSDGKCFSCHANGVRQLIERRTPVLEAKPVRGEKAYGESGDRVPKDFAYHRLLELNRRLRSYGSPDWDGKIILSDLGPALGAAQGCVDCHDGKSRGKLTVFTSTSTLQQKMVHELNMPYDSNLPTLLERLQMGAQEQTKEEVEDLAKRAEAQKALFQDFENSRSAILKDWLLEIPCSS